MLKMDLRSTKTVAAWLLFLNVILNIAFVTSALPTFQCRKCKPGYFVSISCSDNHDTVCSPCPSGTFTNVNNTFLSCTNCTTCTQGFYMVTKCSSTSNTECESCLSGSDCPQSDDSSLSDDIEASSSGSSVGSDKTDDLHKYNDKYEGSGLDEAEEPPTTTESPDDSIEDGSGYSHMPEGDGNETSTTDPDIILPDEVKEDGFLPPSTRRTPTVSTLETTTSTPTSVSTTSSTPTTSPSSSSPTPTTTPSPPPTTTPQAPTTVKTGVIHVTDSGIQIDDKSSSSVAPVGGRTKSTTAKTLPTAAPTGNVVLLDNDDTQSGGKTSSETLDVNINADDNDDANNNPFTYDETKTVADDPPQAGASQRKESGEDSSGVSVGVVVTVALVAAVVFFILGFMANRYWRQRQRTFNVFEAEKTNGTARQNVEFLDPERGNGTNPSRVNEEIPAASKPITSGEPKRSSGETITAEVADPVSAKAVKRSSNPTSRPTSNGAGSAGKPVEKMNELKYMDDVSGDEVETDKLIPKEDQPTSSEPSTSASGDPANGKPPDAAESGATGSPQKADDKNDDDDTENTPMISASIENETDKS